MGISLNPFGSDNHVLLTKLSKQVCVARLKQHMASPTSSRRLTPALPTRLPVYGHISDEHFTIYRSKQSFQTEASGQFVQAEGDTHIKVSLSASLTLKLLIVVFLGLWLFISWGMVDAIRSTGGVLALPIWAIITIILIGIPIAGQWLTRKDGEFLMQFMKDTFESEEASDKHRI